MAQSTTPAPLEAFSGQITPTRVPLVYRLGLGVVAVAWRIFALTFLGRKT